VPPPGKACSDNRERTWQVLKRYQLSMPLLLNQALYLSTPPRTQRSSGGSRGLSAWPGDSVAPSAVMGKLFWALYRLQN